MKRNQCWCVDIPMGSYKNQVVIPDYKGKAIGVDRCIVDEVKLLWCKGVDTIESCCGHNQIQGYIAVTQSSIPSMLEMGYEQYDDRNDIFKPKSI